MRLEEVAGLNLQTEPWRTESSQVAGMELHLYPAARNAEPLGESRRAVNPMADKASSCHEGGVVRQGCTLAWECQGPLAVLRAQTRIPQAAESGTQECWNLPCRPRSAVWG